MSNCFDTVGRYHCFDIVTCVHQCRYTLLQVYFAQILTIVIIRIISSYTSHIMFPPWLGKENKQMTQFDCRHIWCTTLSRVIAFTLDFAVKNIDEMLYFWHDRLWISPWMKLIYNELDITFHVLVSQLSRHIIALWRHQQYIISSSTERKHSEWDTKLMCQDSLFLLSYMSLLYFMPWYT